MPDESITVRLCTVEDLPALHAREAHPSARIAGAHFDRQAGGDYFYAIALRDDVPVGTSVLDCRADNSLRPELKNLWVYPEFRRQGAARALTTFLEQRAGELGFVEVFLKVDPENEAAIPMYIGLDYSPTGDHALTTYEWIDDTGGVNSAEQRDAIYRKSLLVR
ncbi:GNAT family N-acetyltransferase [Propionicimonas sp.]|uniref:GNAT family N-acetyltransferase n=1 Tax=Propionicimonas sp. TaxID=1955623 RepID=UPI0039E34D7C